MDDIKLFAKNEKELETLIQTIRIYRIWHWKICHADNEKWKREVIVKPNQERIKMIGEKENYKCLGMLEVDTIKQAKMKWKIRKEYLRKSRKSLKIKLCSGYLIKGINTWVVPQVQYSGLFLKGTREDLRQMDLRTRKLITMHKVLHSRDDINYMWVFFLLVLRRKKTCCGADKRVDSANKLG